MNDQDQRYKYQQDQATKFLADFFGARPPGYKAPSFALSAELPLNKNQPEFWADTPWRIEPDQEDILLLFLVRDTNIKPPAIGPWRLDMLKIEQRIPDETWNSVLTLLPTDLPKVDNKGIFQLRTWSHSLKLPLDKLKGIVRGRHFTTAGDFSR